MSKINKRILVLTENFPPISGGSGRWFWELYSRLDAEQIVIVSKHHPDADIFDKECGLTIERMPLCCSEWGFKSLSGLSFYIKTVRRLRQIIKRYDIDEIHCGRVIHEGVSAWLLSLFSNIRFICYVHGEDVETAATSGEHNLMVKQVCKKAQYLICNSHNSANIVKRLHYATDEKLHILHPGVDAQKFVPTPPDSAFRERMGWTDKFVILTVGRLQRRKGQDMMVKAMPQILERHPDVVYAVVGDGECKQELQSLIADNALKQTVHLLSEMNDADMIKCYQQCDLFILPNRTIDNDIEGFGMVLVEAQACAKPVIAGDSGGTKETMLPGESGLVIDCSCVANIEASVTKILDARARLSTMGEKGREHVLHELDWSAHVKKAQTLFA